MINDKLNIVFFGTSEFAVPALEILIRENYNIVAVITAPDKPAGRKKTLSPSPVKLKAESLSLKVLQPATLKDEVIFENFKNLNPDLCVIAAYGKIIPKKFLDVPRHGFLNIHPSLLPKYRGPSPVQTAILDGATQTGVTIIVVDEEVDERTDTNKCFKAILESRKWKVESGKRYKELEKELAELGAKLLIETLPKYVSGKVKPVPQDHSQATFTRMFTREDGRINWDNSPDKIYNQIRALNPEPGAWTVWKDKVLNIKKAKLIDEKLKLEIVQMEGRKEVPFKEFLNGYPDFNLLKLK